MAFKVARRIVGRCPASQDNVMLKSLQYNICVTIQVFVTCVQHVCDETLEDEAEIQEDSKSSTELLQALVEVQQLICKSPWKLVGWTGRLGLGPSAKSTAGTLWGVKGMVCPLLVPVLASCRL